MRVLCRLDFKPMFSGQTAVAAGNFDGLHLGHRKILRSLVEQAARRGLKPVVLTFSPHPEKVLGRRNIEMIQTIDQRLEGLRGFGVAAVLVAPFNATFAGLSIGDFVDHVLVRSLRTKLVVVGEDFRFGRKREGDVRSLRARGERATFEVLAVPPMVRGGRTVSSSLIRSLLAAGCVGPAAGYLGHAYEISGTVVRGDARGRTIGFPTANLDTENEILPPGVFLTMALVGAREVPSLTNIGSRPTFGCGPLRVETYLFGYRGDLYRKRLRLRFVKRLRGERTFASREALARQIARDAAAAKKYFGAQRG